MRPPGLSIRIDTVNIATGRKAPAAAVSFSAGRAPPAAAPRRRRWPNRARGKAASAPTARHGTRLDDAARAARLQRISQTQDLQRAREMSQQDARNQRERAYQSAQVQRAYMDMAGHGGDNIPPEFSKSSTLTTFLSDARLHQLKALAPSTWLKYAQAWRKVRQWCFCRLAEIGRARTNKQLSEAPMVFMAYLSYLLASGAHEAAVALAIAATAKVMGLHGLPNITDFHGVSDLRKAAAREHAVAKTHKEGILDWEIRNMIEESRGPKATLVQRIAAACCGLMFDLCLRFSDMARLNVASIYMIRGGAMVSVAWRKNRQNCDPIWLPLNDTGKHGTLRILTDVLRERGFTVPTEGVVTTRTGTRATQLLWPHVKYDKAAGTYDVYEEEGVAISGAPANNRSGQYRTFLDLFRDGMKRTHGYHPRVLHCFATHSMRRGGDLHRFMKGMPADLRMELGDWKTPAVEAAYRACDFRRRMMAAEGAQI